jgi:hypothetical protein
MFFVATKPKERTREATGPMLMVMTNGRGWLGAVADLNKLGGAYLIIFHP